MLDTARRTIRLFALKVGPAGWAGTIGRSCHVRENRFEMRYGLGTVDSERGLKRVGRRWRAGGSGQSATPEIVAADCIRTSGWLGLVRYGLLRRCQASSVVSPFRPTWGGESS
jgi:hypothetical protein